MTRIVLFRALLLQTFFYITVYSSTYNCNSNEFLEQAKKDCPYFGARERRFCIQTKIRVCRRCQRDPLYSGCGKAPKTTFQPSIQPMEVNVKSSNSVDTSAYGEKMRKKVYETMQKLHKVQQKLTEPVNQVPTGDYIMKQFHDEKKKAIEQNRKRYETKGSLNVNKQACRPSVNAIKVNSHVYFDIAKLRTAERVEWAFLRLKSKSASYVKKILRANGCRAKDSDHVSLILKPSKLSRLWSGFRIEADKTKKSLKVDTGRAFKANKWYSIPMKTSLLDRWMDKNIENSGAQILVKIGRCRRFLASDLFHIHDCRTGPIKVQTVTPILIPENEIYSVNNVFINTGIFPFMDIMVKEDDNLKEAPFFEQKNPKRQAQLEEVIKNLHWIVD
ncbi:DgyrCDS556 [Dimorphilus gyrociliatus]|uniref:DgyrCDS556 n=1 Tax=Dimorphilus gyrociliatus TaxID=2664684 RepID=A0A7I8V4S7_9ANNE|nr:DgyrCDS556 [Dimorphilus gyrociliatus]